MLQVKLKGSFHDQGIQHGETFRKEIQAFYALRKELIDHYFQGIPEEKIQNLLSEHVAILKNYPDCWSEFDGIAKASGLTHNALMLLNNYSDFKDFSRSQPQDEDGCSLIAVRNAKAKVAGQTWDMHASAAPYVVHLDIQEPIRMHILTITGGIALAGVNEFGLSVCINNLVSFETKNGLMWGALVKTMLAKKTAREALNFLQAHLPCSGHNYQLMDSTDTFNVETTGKRFLLTYDSNKTGASFHTNHFVSALRETEDSVRRSKTTDSRYRALTEYFQAANPDSHSYQSLRDDVIAGNKTPSVCIRPTSDPLDTMTCGGIVMNLKDKRGEIFAGLYTDGDVHSIQW